MISGTYIGKLITDSLGIIVLTDFFKAIVFLLCFAKTVNFVKVRVQ